MAFPTGWNSRSLVTVAAANVAGAIDFSDFPVLVTHDDVDSVMLDADGANPMLSGGGDIRASSDAAGLTQLAVDVVLATIDNDPANGKLVLWVKIPTLNAASDTTIYIWWEKAAETQPAVGAAFGRNATWSAFQFVLHLNETGTNGTTGEYEDSTGNGYTGIGGGGNAGKTPADSTVDNRWGDSWADFDGTDNYIEIENSGGVFDGSDGYVSIIAKADSITSFNEAFVSNYDSLQANNFFSMVVSTGSKYRGYMNDGTADENNQTGLVTPGTTLVRHYACSWSASKATDYIDGVLDRTDTSIAGDGHHTTTFLVQIGTWLNKASNRCLNGRMGECRGRLDQPTDAYVTTEDATMAGSFLTVGARTDPGAAPPADEGITFTRGFPAPSLRATPATGIREFPRN